MPRRQDRKMTNLITFSEARDNSAHLSTLPHLKSLNDISVHTVTSTSDVMTFRLTSVKSVGPGCLLSWNFLMVLERNCMHNTSCFPSSTGGAGVRRVYRYRTENFFWRGWVFLISLSLIQCTAETWKNSLYLEAYYDMRSLSNIVNASTIKG